MLSANVWGPWRGWRRRRLFKCLLCISAFAFAVSLFTLQMVPLYEKTAFDDIMGKSESESMVRGLRYHKDSGPRNEHNNEILQSDDKFRNVNDEIVGESEEEDDDYEEDNDNPVFREGDFDGLAPQPQQEGGASENGIEDLPYENVDYVSWNAERKLQGQYYDTNVEVQTVGMVDNEKSTHRLIGKSGVPIVENGIFWSINLENKTPKGFDDDYVKEFQSRVRNMPVASVQPPSWDRCGRPKNQFIILADGTSMCARYRTPHDYLVQGEVMSFYLARLLGIQNVPIVVLSQAAWNSHQWKRKKVRHQVKAAGWTPNATVALIQWIHHLERDRMPRLLLDALRAQSNISIATSELSTFTAEKLSELLQWSDLIIFDYITGNYDRVASMQDAAEKEKKPSILSETIHNLVKSKKTHGLWLIDNESGLLDAYSLLYSTSQPNHQAGRFIEFHFHVLRTMCIFRRSTHDKIEWLHHHGDAKKLLLDAIDKSEPLFSNLPDVQKNVEFVLHFQRRIADVYHHLRHCYDQALTVS